MEETEMRRNKPKRIVHLNCTMTKSECVAVRKVSDPLKSCKLKAGVLHFVQAAFITIESLSTPYKVNEMCWFTTHVQWFLVHKLQKYTFDPQNLQFMVSFQKIIYISLSDTTTRTVRYLHKHIRPLGWANQIILTRFNM